MFRKFRKLKHDEDGAVTAEFVILFPLLFMIVVSVFEAGLLMTRYMMLDRGVDMAMREMRLGINPGADHDSIRDRICNFADILPDCTTTLIVELVKQSDAPVGYPWDNPNCYDRTETVLPVLNVDPDPDQAAEIMYVRVCALVDPIMPGLEFGLMLPKDETGAHQMIAFGAFINEPT